MGSRKGRDSRKTLVSVTGLAVLLAILIVVNVILSFASVRWDVTEDQVYSLSKGTGEVLSNMDRPVTIQFFYSRSNKNLPASIKIYARRVKEFLSEYERASKGRIEVEVHDPKVDSDEEEWAQKYGMRPMQLQTGDKIYCGLVFLAADQEQTIPLLDPSREELLEYDITRIIHRLQDPEKGVVAIISALPLFGGPVGSAGPARSARGEPWLFVTELKKTCQVREIPPTAGRIHPSVDLLVIVHPRDISPKLEYAIDQYVLSGGNALIFVDPFCVSDQSQGQYAFMRPSSSNLERLFKAWGISMDAQKVVADLGQATRVQLGQRVEENPTWISARGDSLSPEDVVTSRLERMLFPVVGAIEKPRDSQDYEFEPLVRSGKNAAVVEVFKAGLGASAVRRDFVPSAERFNFAVRLGGRFKTAFPDGPPGKDDPQSSSQEKGKEGHLESGVAESNLIVVGDADMLADRFYVRRSRVLGFNLSKTFNDNLNFFSNASEILMGSDVLVGLRSRGRFERPFTVVLDLKRKAQERWLAKEKELLERAERANQKLRELQRQKDASQRLLMSPEQEAEMVKFREEKRKINRELKEVRKNLRADIETLGAVLKGINIFLVPLLVSLAGLGFAVYKHRRVKKS